jgi:hypothetical protein
MELTMILHTDPKLFKQAIQFTSDQLNIPAIFIEKDYWVTYALNIIFHSPVGNDTIFKGGTSLSKCYDLIDRFSEDIDLVVLRREGETDSKLKNKIREIGKTVETVLPEIKVEGLTVKKGMNRKTAHTYNKEFNGDFGQVRDTIILEATWLGYHEPYETKTINSFVGKMMLNNKQEKLAQKYGLLPFDIRVLEPTRTICEKIMSLVRFSYGENPIDDLKKKVRHTYDLHQLLQQEDICIFFQSDGFEKMLLKVANDDVASFRNNNQWLSHHPNESLFFSKLEEVWNELKETYNGDFRNLVYGILPEEKDVLSTLHLIHNRITPIEWKIAIEAEQ